MPELWVPYGRVETMVTLQAENLGVVVGGEPEKPAADMDRLAEEVKKSTALFVCDSRPTTAEVLKGLVQALGDPGGPRVIAAAPKAVESAVPELRGRVTTLPPPISSDRKVAYAEPLTQEGWKVFLGTASPDPLYGVADAKVEACLNWVSGSGEESFRAAGDAPPAPFAKGQAYGAMEELASKVREGRFVTVVPRGGEPHAVLEDAPFDVIKNGFPRTAVPPSKALVVGAGGRGYDDSLSGALRAVWGALPCVRKSGQILILAECSEGLGSVALQMAATRQKLGARGGYVEGLEEVGYLARLKQDYEPVLLSGLPETFAKTNLGLATAAGAGEGVGKILNKVGRTTRVNVVQRAPECWVESG